MAISRAKKTEKVQLLANELQTSTTAIVGTFSKLTVAKDFALRKVIREAGGKYRVVKNKLAAVSGTGTQVEAALKGLKGVNSVAFTAGDPVALARVFAKWAGDNAAEFQFKLGIVDGKLLNVDEVKSLATMPGKEELYSRAALPHQCAGAAAGHRAQRHGDATWRSCWAKPWKEKFAGEAAAWITVKLGFSGDGFAFVVESDIDDFFPSIDHGRLEGLLRDVLPAADAPLDTP